MENASKSGIFQAKGHRYPHLQPSWMATGLKGRCLQLPQTTTNCKQICTKHQETDQTGYWTAGILLINCPQQMAGPPSSSAMVKWIFAGCRREMKIKTNGEILNERNRRKEKGCNLEVIFCTLLSYLFLLIYMKKQEVESKFCGIQQAAF